MQFSCLDVVLFSSRVWLVVAEFVADTFLCWQHRSPRNSLPPVAAEFREGPLPHLWRTSPGWSVPQSWGREVTYLPLLVEGAGASPHLFCLLCS